MTDQLEVRALATQLIRNAIKEIDSEVACDHVVATLGEDVDVDALAFGSEKAVREARIGISWDGSADPRIAGLIQLVQGLITAYSDLASNVAAYVPDHARPELVNQVQALRQEAVDRIAEISAWTPEDPAAPRA